MVNSISRSAICIAILAQHTFQNFGEEFPGAFLNAARLAFARPRHVQDEGDGMLCREKLSEPTPDLPLGLDRPIDFADDVDADVARTTTPCPLRGNASTGRYEIYRIDQRMAVLIKGEKTASPTLVEEDLREELALIKLLFLCIHISRQRPA